MRLMQAVREVLKEDPRCRRAEFNWLFMAKVLRLMGFKIFLQFDRNMPSPETLFRERREIMNKRNEYPENFTPEEGVTYQAKPTK